MSKQDKSPRRNENPDRVRYGTIIRILKVFGVHLKNQWKLLALALSGLVFSVAMNLLSPWPLKLILDYVILKHPFPEKAAFVQNWLGTDPYTLLMALAMAFLVLQLTDSFISYVFKVGVMVITARIMNDIRERIFAHLQKLSLSFHESFRSGDLVYRLTSDIHELPLLLLGVPLNIFYRLITIVAYIGLMWVMEWRLALIAFSVIPIMSYFHRRIGSGLQTATQKKRSKESDITSLIAENVTAMALVQAYGREDLQQARFVSENRQSLDSGITAMRLSKVFKRISDILVALGTAGVVYYGGTLAMAGTILPGTLVLFAAYLRKLYSPVDKFAGMLLDVAKAQVSGERLLELVESESDVREAPNAAPAPSFKGLLEFRNVDFAYRKGIEVFNNLNFIAVPGETVAIVGHSGAGKSTFVSLLLRFYDPQAGQILIDGRDLREFTLKSLRSRMTVLMQEAKLFNKTVRENIEFGKAGATEEEIVRAATLAQAHDFIIQMPEGYDTMISEGGDNLSGGQLQRLNIARAIIRNTPILILDEPATALDAKVEAKIHEALAELTQGKTTFIIAHKFATITRAGKTLVLEKGQPAAFGTHEQLLNNSPAYRELYELQLGLRLDYAREDDTQKDLVAAG